MTMSKLPFSRRPIALFLAVFLNLILAAAVGAKTNASSAGEAIYLIQLEGAPLATYKGTVKGMAATSPSVTGKNKLDTQSTAARIYAAHLGQERTDTVSRMVSVLGRAVKTVHQYDTAFNGLAVRLSAAEAAAVAKLPGVIRVERDRLVRIQSQAAPASASVFAAGRTGGRADNSPSGFYRFILPSILFLVAVWGALRRRRQWCWLWVSVAAGLLVLTAACGDDSHDAHTASVESPADLTPSPGAAWIGAQGVWTGIDTGELPGTMGEGVVVGIIDTGISPHSPSFAAMGDDGYVHTNPRGRFYGVCDPENQEIYNPNFPCNDKLIGAWSFVDDEFNHTGGNAVDLNGHGSHVAATAAGNIVHEAVVHTPTGLNLSSSISGVAPHANIVSYRVLGADGSGPASTVLAGIEQAIEDGVDVINMSLGGGLYNPWTDPLSGLPLLSARDAGIFVTVAAGNDGPAPATIDTPGVIPWVTSVAAGTHATAYVNTLSLSGGSEELPDIRGLGLTTGYGPAPIVYAGDFGDPLCRGNFTASFDGEIVICDRGELALVEKGQHVKANGGGGMVLAEVEPGGEEALLGVAHYLPAVHITKEDTDRLKEWLAQGAEHKATISGSVKEIDPKYADFVGSFSSRGWNRMVPDNLTPDILAPGVSIFAPVVDGVGYAIWNGTSMASPHVAGVFALLKALHPDWTPSEAQSAVMTTAGPARLDDQGTAATPFEAGAGRIDAGRAARVALVLDETAAGFERTDPKRYGEAGEPGLGDPAAMNLASLGAGSCAGSCSWTRVIRSVASGTTSWFATALADPGLSLAVEPENFTIASGESIEIAVTADVSGIPIDQWAFGRVVLSEADGEAPEAGFPVAVRSAEQKFPESIRIGAEQASGSKRLYPLGALGITDLAVSVLGLSPATVEEGLLDGDPTPEDPANQDGGVYLVMVEVPAGAAALRADLDSPSAPELNLYLGMGDSTQPLAAGNGKGAVETVSVSSPQAGTWWIAVHDPSTGRQGDPFTLRYGVVMEAEAGNLTATPERTDGSPFGLALDWNLPGTVAGDFWYGAITLGTSAATPGDIGTIPVRLEVQ